MSNGLGPPPPALFTRIVIFLKCSRAVADEVLERLLVGDVACNRLAPQVFDTP